MLAAATSRDGRPAGSRPTNAPQEKAVIPVLRKKNLRSMFECSIDSKSLLSIFDRPITYTRPPLNAIIPLVSSLQCLGRRGNRVPQEVATNEKIRTYEEA